MARNYFNYFPNTVYADYQCKNIMAGVELVDRYVNTPYLFYRFDVDRDQRADVVAEQYYNDPYMTWAIYYANKIRDPYYDWFLPYEQFNTFIADKYGSVEYSQKKIKYFRTNWYSDSRELSTTQFNAFFGEYKYPYSTYWDPNFDPNTGRLYSYTRKQQDRIVNTNKIVKVGVSNNSTSNTSKLSIGDLIDIRSNSLTVGTAEVIKSNTSFIHLQHVLGDIANNYNLHLDNSNTYCTISNYSLLEDYSNTVWTKTVIPEDEYIYWEPVYAYDIEDEINTSKRNIRLIDSLTAYKIHDKLEEELKK